MAVKRPRRKCVRKVGSLGCSAASRSFDATPKPKLASKANEVTPARVKKIRDMIVLKAPGWATLPTAGSGSAHAEEIRKTQPSLCASFVAMRDGPAARNQRDSGPDPGTGAIIEHEGSS